MYPFKIKEFFLISMFLCYDGYDKYITRSSYSVCFKFRHTRLFRPTCLLFFSKDSTIHVYLDTTFIRDRRLGPKKKSENIFILKKSPQILTQRSANAKQCLC